ncbi:transmembrane protein [Mycolicibacterium vulneris]|nr:transmembrane protein [Mycolicibacterium vulneris]
MTTTVRHVSRVAANTLGGSTSPYLRQHADNPVHWREWTPEALAEAASRDVPILLSIGYAACHWCHVMAHESFEDADVAAVLNDGFVCIKVDREERPDLDAVYMNATVALTGHRAAGP